MFTFTSKKRKEKSLSCGEPVDDKSNYTCVSAGSLVKGNLDIDGDMHVYGEVEASIKCNGTINVYEGGRLSGDIVSCKIFVAGKALGTFECNVLTVDKDGNLSGTVIADELNIASGGIFNGESRKRIYDKVTQVTSFANVKTLRDEVQKHHAEIS